MLILGIILILIAATWITWAVPRHEGPGVRSVFELFWLGFILLLAVPIGLVGALLAIAAIAWR